ncbi:MAG TPA: DNA cytosine methyltransferase [Coxiellaceae bacterium]|nr:MAG: DNA (cytosine-5-)-methyltransferase [Gammaproteobacteria bacterium RIFCSPHIGHO2_12_FULL_36_30]HLB57064.1 DNA cytosine methyltransferase [Coxiellaceae bacterium]
MDQEFFSLQEVSNMLSISKEKITHWEKTKKLIPSQHPTKKTNCYHRDQLKKFDEAKSMLDTNWDDEIKIKPNKEYKSIELFAGCGGLALGLEKAGFKHVLLNEINKDACDTLKKNRPDWDILQQDISQLSFSKFKGKVDLVTGGFPCQAFSYAGNKLGFEDTRGTMFFEFARAIKEVKPKVFLAENVRGLLNHDNGKTLSAMKEVIASLGYTLIEPRVLKAIHYQVPQKRERLILIGIRNDYAKKVSFTFPSPYKKIMTVRDALKAGELFETDVPNSDGQKYPKRKKEILSQVPPGGYWRDLPKKLQIEFMQKSYYLGGGKTGMARRLSWDEPSLTLTCAPAQKQTERCHPEETRPLTVREYARIQTFPDDWTFEGSQSSVYKQIGNAVPVNFAQAIGRSIIKLLNDISEL